MHWSCIKCEAYKPNLKLKIYGVVHEGKEHFTKEIWDYSFSITNIYVGHWWTGIIKHKWKIEEEIQVKCTVSCISIYAEARHNARLQILCHQEIERGTRGIYFPKNNFFPLPPPLRSFIPHTFVPHSDIFWGYFSKCSYFAPIIMSLWGNKHGNLNVFVVKIWEKPVFFPCFH